MDKKLISIKKKKRWGTKSHLVLEVLKEGAFSTAEIFANIFLNPTDMHNRYAHAYFGVPIKNKKEIKIPRNTKISFYNVLLSLEKQGLVERKSKKWKLSGDGRDSIKEIRKKKPREYLCENQKNYTIVAFDIPEKIKEKRSWIRETLKEMGFSLLQQSVWIGNKKIPKNFIEDLYDLGIFNYVHVFEVTKRGTVTK
ncbi:MAG: hypothetical protein WC842_00375 [Candidatus Paceibacterota bacterium]|jgi:hypothetical protein